MFVMESLRLQREQLKSNSDLGKAKKSRTTNDAGFQRPLAFTDKRPNLHLNHNSLPFPLQAKLTVNQPGDQYEQEADRVAEQVMRMPDRAVRLQRKCGCGGSTSGTSCVECGGGLPILQRRPTSQGGSPAVPSIVHDVLRAPGHPLDQSTRGFFEARFGHDFSHVRVHTDARAAVSAAAVNASAYTVGPAIVFGGSKYAPQTLAGQRLLAHELAHTIQQQSMPALQRQSVTPVDLVPTEPEEAERLRREHGINLPQVSPQTWAAIGGGGNHANQTLTAAERATITRMTGTAAPASPLAVPQGPRFVLHDTAGAVGASWIQTQQQMGRGPLADTGSAAFIPGTGPATVTRGSLFDPHRPASTQYERGQDIMVKATRNLEYRNVWRATSSTEQTAALTRALANQGLTTAEINTQTSGAIAELNASSGDVHTAASWAISEICGRVASVGAATVASSAAVVNDLTGACQRLAPLFAAREARIASTVNVEMVQPGGSGCSTTGALTRLPDYTPNQYNNVMLLYLRSALQVGQFPLITTHFWIDKNIGDHCDPRCFNLSGLYRMIRTALGHGVGSTYGINPNYGSGSAHNVWWNDTVCGRPHP